MGMEHSNTLGIPSLRTFKGLETSSEREWNGTHLKKNTKFKAEIPRVSSWVLVDIGMITMIFIMERWYLLLTPNSYWESEMQVQSICVWNNCETTSQRLDHLKILKEQKQNPRDIELGHFWTEISTISPFRNE